MCVFMYNYHVAVAIKPLARMCVCVCVRGIFFGIYIYVIIYMHVPEFGIKRFPSTSACVRVYVCAPLLSGVFVLIRSDRCVRVWDTLTGACVAAWQAHFPLINAAAVASS